MTLQKMLFILALFLAFGSLGSAQVRQDAGANLPIQWGEENAKYRIEVFLDLQCPQCANYNEILKSLKKKYPSQILITFRHFEIPSHDKAFLAARAVEAAHSQNKAFEMMDIILAKQKDWTESEKAEQLFFEYAKQLGLKIEQFRRDFNSEQTGIRIRQDISRAKSLKIYATPSVLLNGKLIEYMDALNIVDTISKEQ